MKRVAVVGGGASGMMAAISAAGSGADVCLFEKNDRVGKKILMTGNGKCNFSNRDFGMENYNGACKDRLPEIFSGFTVEDSVEFFRKAGMLVKEKNGYLYPLSEQASTVLDILRLVLARLKVEIRLCSSVEKIEAARRGEGFRLSAAGKAEAFDAVIIACGGAAAPGTGSDAKGYKLAQSLGHSLVPCVPALVQLRCEDSFLKGLGGVRCEATVSLADQGRTVQAERGELQFTDYGISGIPVFQLSRRAAYMLKEKKQPCVYLDLLPAYGEEEYHMLCRERINSRAGKSLEEFLLGMANKKINMTLLRLSGLKPVQEALQVEEERLFRLLSFYRRLCVHVTGTNSFDHAQVTAGGVDMRGIAATMESLSVPGLYFAGEILDVDGRCGGYNLQWAWTSGWVSGRNAAQEEKK